MTIRITVKNVFDTLQQRIDKLKNLYSEFIRDNDNQMFIFGLDSFHFQSKLIDIEYEDMTRMFLAINNRMYCEYFKLYKIIVAYISVNITDKKILEVIKVSNFPTYKDLEPFKDYKFEIIQEIHENILILIGSIVTNIETKDIELSEYQRKRKIGLNIDNFVTSFNYDIIMMRERGMLFLTYMEFFHQLHTKYMKRFSSKIQLMYSHIDKDIDFSDTIDIQKDKISEFSDETSELSDELFDSIDDDTNSEITRDPVVKLSPELHRAFNSIESRCKTILTPMNEDQNVLFRPLDNKVLLMKLDEIALDDNKYVVKGLDETDHRDNKSVVTETVVNDPVETKLDEIIVKSVVIKSDDNNDVVTKLDDNKSGVNKPEDNNDVVTKLDEIIVEENKSDVIKPEDNKHVVSDAVVTESVVINADDNKCDITKLDDNKCDITKLDDNKPDITEFVVIKSDDNKHVVRDAVVTNADDNKCDITKLDDNKSDITKLDDNKPDITEFVVIKSDDNNPDVNEPDLMKSDVTESGETKYDDNNSTLVKSDVTTSKDNESTDTGGAL
jgi:hypothetical protein